jgi:hypothetical protein
MESIGGSKAGMSLSMSLSVLKTAESTDKDGTHLRCLLCPPCLLISWSRRCLHFPEVLDVVAQARCRLLPVGAWIEVGGRRNRVAAQRRSRCPTSCWGGGGEQSRLEPAVWRVDGGRAAERASMWAAMQQVGWGMAAARQEERRGWENSCSAFIYVGLEC